MAINPVAENRAATAAAAAAESHRSNENQRQAEEARTREAAPKGNSRRDGVDVTG